MTAVMFAAYGGHLEVVMKLAELGVDLAAVDKVSTALYPPFPHPPPKHAGKEWGASLYSHHHQEGRTALAFAAVNGQVEVVVKLAELGVDLAAVNDVSTVIFANEKHIVVNNGC